MGRELQRTEGEGQATARALGLTPLHVWEGAEETQKRLLSSTVAPRALLPSDRGRE